ncbi:MAG: ABC transporter permease subunit [Pirellula sp.]
MSNSDNPAFRTRRDRNSSWWVRVSDRVAKQVITVGGIGTILVVMLVVLVLLGNVLPMFQPNAVEPLGAIDIQEKVDAANPNQDAQSIACGVDEYMEILWTLRASGYVTVHAISNGQSLGTFRAESPGDMGSAKITCAAVAQDDASLVAGLDNGTVRPITISFATEFIKTADAPDDIAGQLGTGFALSEGVIYRSLPSGLIRKQSISGIRFHSLIHVSNHPITAVDWKLPQAVSSFDESQTWVWGATDGNRVAMGHVENKVNAFNGTIEQNAKTWTNTASEVPAASPIIALMLGSRGDQLLSLDRSGRVVSWGVVGEDRLVSNLTHVSLAGDESKATMATPLLGRSTMLIASDSGHIEGVATTSTHSGQELLSIHRFAQGNGSVTDMEAAPESRMVAASFANGNAALYYVPTNRKLLDWKLSSTPTAGSSEQPIGQLFFSANAACIGHVKSDQVTLWRLKVPFPEASLGSFFSRIWYEGYEGPQHVWQSSTGNVEGEYKFGFIPLIFGTFKATCYSMLIGAPIALMAAIFGSEFMSSRWRARVKPLIELMASIPSVVLGFIGALVLAPFLRDHLMMVLLSVALVLFLFLLAAHLWLVIPSPTAIRLRRLRLPILFLLIPTGIWMSSSLAASVERILFGGDLIDWLSNRGGSGWSGWLCMLILPVSIFVAWALGVPLNPSIKSWARRMGTFPFAMVNVGLFLSAVLAVLLISGFLAWGFSMAGWDPRGSVLGPYQERNALLVGSILGFAIIPLIYTISEDALQSVPQHLRSASLACGATTWQTTIRVVVPTAMSGLFSALMIGFGRAVGETMVVLMAAGNTPVMDINPMNGYRTLSATLATELPEAARGSTHFHALFLAALLLFCFTMVANTLAEIVRMRFRKRAYQL